MNKAIYTWQTTTFPITLQEMGLKEDATMIDFGCGEGNYTIGMAYYCRKGTIYGLDTSTYALNQLKRNISSHHLTNIIPCTSLPTHLSHVNAIFICDLIHMLLNRKHVLKSLKTLLYPTGILCIAPFHMNTRSIQSLIQELEQLGYSFIQELPNTSIHFEMQPFIGSMNDPLEDFEHGSFYIFKCDRI